MKSDWECFKEDFKFGLGAIALLAVLIVSGAIIGSVTFAVVSWVLETLGLVLL